VARPNIFQIENGQFGLAMVDTDEVGYLDSWQAPGGVTVDVATLADYEAASASWSCQITSGALEASPDTTTTDVPATWCEPAETIPAPGKTSFTFTATFLQDPNVVDGLNAFLFEHDTEEAYIFAGLDGLNPPRLIGRCRLAAGTIGGEARTSLTADLSLPMSRKPTIEFGNAASSRIVAGDPGAPVAPMRGAAAPGMVFPADPGISAQDSTTAAELAGEGFVALPLTAWTTGQKITIGDYSFNWTGSAWAAGAHA
jgi:hypothetical protein